jgi:hypothetical protein
MHKLLRKKVNWLGKCLLCKKEPSLCKCGLSKDMGEGMGTTTTNLQMSKGKDMHPIIKRSLKCGLSKDMGMDGMPSESDGMMMMSEKRLPKKTKKSENFIDLKNENIPGKRIKNVGGAGYTPGEKKIEKIKAKGSGGELGKSIKPSKP